MTREEAISWLTNEKWKNANNKYKKEWNEAFDLAIEALSVANLKEEFESADAVQGEWEDKEVFNDTDDDHIVEEWQSARCSVCGKYHTTPYMYYFDNFKFCPNCGARMKGGDTE